MLALKHLADGNASFVANLGTGRGHYVREVIGAVEEVTGRTVDWRIGPRRPGDPPILVADPSRAQALLGWQATRSLSEMVASAWTWMQQTGIQHAAAVT